MLEGPRIWLIGDEASLTAASERVAGGPQWKLATCAGDVLISHAGVSSDFAADLAECGGDLTEFCRRLDEEHTRAVELELRSGDWKAARTRGKRSPTRYKLEKYGAEGLLPGVTQVIGHTPPEKLARGHDVTPSVALAPRAVGGAALAAHGLYLVDPSVQWSSRDGAPSVRYHGPPAPGRYRYAVIQSGRFTVHESPGFLA